MSGVSSRAQPGADIERGARIKAERSRLGLTLADFAARAGVSKSSQILYEKGNPPTVEWLARAGEAGADIMVIVTGERRPQPQSQAALSPLPDDTGVLATLASAGAGLGFGDVAGGVALAVLFTAGLWVAYGTGLAMCGGCW